ncbi:hypothetical protein KJ359_009255 [Pestalotiopsis sp. 9143b]|nr:hypothetical protein KJ359_009255 [Pestalotiopsis sp. 9143b]
MYENFTFHRVEEVNPPGPDDDASVLEPRLSPKARSHDPAGWYAAPEDAPATTTTIPTEPTPQDHRPTSSSDGGQHGSPSIDHIADRLSRQTLLPYVRSNGQVSAVSRMEDVSTEWLSLDDDDPMASFAMPFRRVQLRVPRVAVQNTYNRAPSQSSGVAPPSNKTPPPVQHVVAQTLASNESTSPSASLESLPQTKASDDAESSEPPRVAREALVESMISHGVQCNVQNPTTAPPMPAGSPLPALEAWGMESETDQPMLEPAQGPYDSSEVDDLLAESDGLALMRSMASLRQAGRPSGIRRANGLNYRSSAESAVSLGNKRGLVRNKLKMRRRDKPKLTDPNDPKQMATPPPEDTTMSLLA